MLDVRLIRNDPDAVRAGLARRGEDPAAVDLVHELDAELRSLGRSVTRCGPRSA